jgi:hypothetical protein
MRYLRTSLIGFLLLLSCRVNAIGVFLEPLYWRATEPIDWALNNNENFFNQTVTYKTVDFNADLGIRVGLNIPIGTWNNDFYYTNYYTQEKDNATGHLTSAFLGGKIALPSSLLSYDAGQVEADINYNMFDWDLSKDIRISDKLILRPIIGLRGGWIDQSVNTRFQGDVSVRENVDNDFNGIGPKVGLETTLTLFHHDDYDFNLFANFQSAYLWGNWSIDDTLYDNLGKRIDVNVDDRTDGALALQAIIGANLHYKKIQLQLGYEINDWLNQCQIFDDATGPHNNDLILQGISLKMVYSF